MKSNLEQDLEKKVVEIKGYKCWFDGKQVNCDVFSRLFTLKEDGSCVEKQYDNLL